MTVHFPDVSNHQQGLSLAGAPACIAKATEGSTFVDRSYAGFKAQASAMGIPFAAYHWLHAGDIAGQARNAFNRVGPTVPLMVDDEDTSDGLDINRTLAFVQAYRALGGTVTLEYLPQWFWAAHGKPDLRPLATAGLSLISSGYTTYSDNGVGWRPYGGVTPSIWQYSDSTAFNGQLVDFNAFKGTVDELRALFTGNQGGDMALSDLDAQALIYRVEAIINNRPTVVGGPTSGERNALHDKLEEIEAKIEAIPAGPTGPPGLVGEHTHEVPPTGPAVG